MSTTITRGRPPATLAGYSDEELCDFYNASTDEAWQATLTAEMDRRDREEHAPAAFRRSGPARRDPVRAEWHDAAHAQYLAASADLNGELVRRGSHVRSDFELWRGSETFALANCTEELRLWWQRNPRVTVTAYRDQARAQREAYRYDAMDADGTGPVRHERAAASADGTVSGAGSVRDAGHGGPDRSGRAVRRDEMEAGQISTGPSEATARLMRKAEAINAERDRRAAGQALAGEQDSPRVTEPPEAYRRSQGAVALRVGSAIVPARPLIDGDQTLRYIYTFLKHFAHWASEAELIAATLWVAATHARDDKGYPVGQYCARLAIVGASGSGKSQKSRLIGKLSYSGEILVEPTAPAFIDMCAENHTVIMTEADEAFRSPGRSRKILAVANASYEPDRSSSRKQGGVAVKIRLFCHLVLDGIDEVLLNPNRPDLAAMMSRCIIILSRRAPEGYRAPRFDARARATAEMISQRATAWMAQEVAAGMADDVPSVPEHLGNRPFALWEQLFTVAGRADRALRDRARPAGEDDPGHPWSDACWDACEQLEQATGVPDQTEDQASELDRQMAAYGFGEDVLL